MPCDDCLSRREFLSKSTLVAAGAAAFVAGCGDGEIGAPSAPAVSGRTTLKVSTLPGLATAGQLVVLPADDRIAVKRTGATTFVAISTICMHQGCTTGLASNAFQCPCHGARYDAEGNVTRQPQNTSGSTSKLLRHVATYDAATDVLTIESQRISA